MKRLVEASVNINRSASGAKLAKMSSKVHAYVTDWQGNVRAVASKQGSGTVVEQATWYYPYGMPTCDSRSADVNRYKYTAKELITDHSTNLYDYPTRLYDPILGRWLSTDPQSHYYASESHYNFCANDPINRIDNRNPSPKEYDPYSPTQKNGIFIHSTNSNGYAGDNPINHKAVSTGCILIAPQHLNSFVNQIGKRDFLFILRRDK